MELRSELEQTIPPLDILLDALVAGVPIVAVCAVMAAAPLSFFLLT